MLRRTFAVGALLLSGVSCEPQDGAPAQQAETKHLADQMVEMYATGNWGMVDALVAAHT